MTDNLRETATMATTGSATSAHRVPTTRIAGGVAADTGFWDGLEAGEFRMPRCRDCQTWQWPAHHRCGECGCWELEWVPIEPTGTVYTWTRNWYAFDRTQERAEDVPYVVVLAEIPAAGGARVLGALAGSEDGLAIGAAVIGVMDPPSPKSKGYPAVRWSLAAGGSR